jgi:hypothetical protein
MTKVSETLQWRRSARCGSNTCVEVARSGDRFLVRDSKNPQRDPFVFTHDEWTAFLAGIREGDFDFG